MRVSLERHSEQIVGNAQIAVGAARDRFRHDSLHLLRHHADIGGVAAIVDEAIVAEPVVEPPKQHDIVLEAQIGAATPAAAAPATVPVPAAAVEAAPAAPAMEAAGARAAVEAAGPCAARASGRSR